MLHKQNLALLGLASVSAHAVLFESPVQTKNGLIQGYPTFNSSPTGVYLPNWADITAWKGVTFAASTESHNRFRPPQPRAPWNETLDAKDFGDTCPGEASGAACTLGENWLRRMPPYRRAARYSMGDLG